MNLKDLYIDIITPQSDKVDKKWYSLPFYIVLCWIIFSVISIFTIDLSIIADPFVIVSILARILLPLYGLIFIKKFYLIGKMKPVNYNHRLNFIGYSISLTYVSYMLPGIVLKFYSNSETPLVFAIFVVLATAAPAALYILLRSGKMKLNSGFYTKKELEYERKAKKDKVLKKENQKRLRKARNPIQNIWFEVLDPLMWAILWVLIINNTIFQLYEIPSSSMVPEFLEKDRVVAGKILSGPALPLTTYQFPAISKPEVGDIVTFNNPKVDDPQSDLHYKNVFTRIFQPFVFMLTFSNVDIDADENGNPKARQLVKRVIAGPGEKISMVNDKVYKKTEDSEWTLQSEIFGEQEWGRSDLFSLDNKNSGNQYMNPALRAELDSAADLVWAQDVSLLEESLKSEKESLIGSLNSMTEDDLIDFGNKLMSYNRLNYSSVTDVIENIEKGYINMMRINRLTISTSGKEKLVDEFNEALVDYRQFTIFDKINDLNAVINDNSGSLSKLSTEVYIPSNPSPYATFTAKLDGLIRLRNLEFYNEIVQNEEIKFNDNTVDDLKKLAIYVSGLQFTNYIQPFYGAGNLPEFPAGEGDYIPEGEFFLMGDNRYNSLDSRMGDTYFEYSLNNSNNMFSETTTVCWEPHTISDYYIHGKVKVIIFPFAHFKLF